MRKKAKKCEKEKRKRPQRSAKKVLKGDKKEFKKKGNKK